MPLEAATSCWKTFTFPDEDGQMVEVVLKCLDRSTDRSDANPPFVFWELRRMTPFLVLTEKKVWRIMKGLQEDMRRLSMENGMTFRDHFHFTYKAALAQKLDTDMVSSEFECSTALILLLLSSRFGNRIQRVVNNARKLFVLFLQATLSPNKAEECLLSRFPDDVLEASGTTQEALIGDVRLVNMDLGCVKSQGGTPHERLGLQFWKLTSHAKTYAIVQDCLESLVWSVTAAVDTCKIWESSFKRNYLTAGVDLVIQSTKKRCRMDNDLQRALGEDVAKKRKAGTTGAFLRATELYSEKHGLRFNTKVVCSSLAASWAAFENVEHMSICVDGVRSGCPSTENLFAPAYNVETRVSTWLPPVEPLTVVKCVSSQSL